MDKTKIIEKTQGKKLFTGLLLIVGFISITSPLIVFLMDVFRQNVISQLTFTVFIVIISVGFAHRFITAFIIPLFLAWISNETDKDFFFGVKYLLSLSIISGVMLGSTLLLVELFIPMWWEAAGRFIYHFFGVFGVKGTGYLPFSKLFIERVLWCSSVGLVETFYFALPAVVVYSIGRRLFRKKPEQQKPMTGK